MPSALMLCPEPPYPMTGGGPLRTACLLEYLAQRYSVDVIAFREPGAADPLDAMPRGLVRHVQVIPLPYHSKSGPARVARNLLRYYRDVPPLIDRFAGFELNLVRSYDLAVIEHFWCAPYVDVIRKEARRVVLNVHNVESVLLARCRATENPVGNRLMRRFSSACKRLESELLPKFDTLLVTSDEDRAAVGSGTVLPNAIPLVSEPQAEKRHEIVFSGNMAYQPNVSAVRYFGRSIWPIIRRTDRSVTWRLAGKNPEALRVRRDPRIRVTGAMEDAVAEIASARAAVVPLLSGSGTRFKILEAWAAGTPVVSTSIGAEGLGAIAGEHLLIADTPKAFAAAVLRVLEDKALAGHLAASGRRLYEAKFTWPAVWKTLEAAEL